MRVCGVSFRCGSLYNSNSIYIMHYHCCNNMFTHTHTSPQETQQRDKNGDDIRMTGYRPIKLLGQRDSNLGIPSSKLFLQATTDVFTYDMHKLNIQQGSVWPYVTSPERTGRLISENNDQTSSEYNDIYRLLRKLNIRYTAHKSLPPVPIN